ncbi:hypothetical protein BAE44_0009538, partial [Dichanthelium oligosanthes]
LWGDYFYPDPIYNASIFRRRRYRVRLSLFARIADAMTQYDKFSEEKENVAGKLGCHPYQKVAACFRMLANWCSADSLDAEL